VGTPRGRAGVDVVDGAASRERRPGLFLVGEGKSEVGGKSTGGRPDLRTAVLPQLLARYAAGETWRADAPLPFSVAGAETWGDLRVQRHPGGRIRFRELRRVQAHKVNLAITRARHAGADGLVLLLDREVAGRLNPRKDVLEEIRAYRSGTADRLAVVAGIPSRCLETWLLADSSARRKVLGSQATSPFSRKSPERRPNAETRKRYLASACKSRNLAVPEARKRLAAAARPEELRKRCPRSYGAFADEMDLELTPLWSA